MTQHCNVNHLNSRDKHYCWWFCTLISQPVFNHVDLQGWKPPSKIYLPHDVIRSFSQPSLQIIFHIRHAPNKPYEILRTSIIWVSRSWICFHCLSPFSGFSSRSNTHTKGLFFNYLEPKGFIVESTCELLLCSSIASK